MPERLALPARQRIAALLFTDIVDSTGTAARLGNLQWADLLERHDERTRAKVEEFGGDVIDMTGDGVFALFDHPVQAVDCAQAVHAEMRKLQLHLRAGVHVGEVAVRQERVTGLAVHIAERITALAHAGETLASGAVKEAAASPATAFVDRGVHTLRGVPEGWQLFSVQPGAAYNGPFGRPPIGVRRGLPVAARTAILPHTNNNAAAPPATEGLFHAS